MHIEVEKQKDKLFQNSTKYDELIRLVKDVALSCETLDNFKEKIVSEWDDIVDKCCIKSPIHIYKYDIIEKENNKNGKYVMFCINSEIDENKLKIEKERINKAQYENEIKIKQMISDEIYLNDMRVTQEMINSYKATLMETKSTLIKNPHYILENMNESKQIFYEYLIDVLQNKEYSGIKRKIMLDNEYTKYMSLMTGIEVILPDELKYI